MRLVLKYLQNSTVNGKPIITESSQKIKENAFDFVSVRFLF